MAVSMSCSALLHDKWQVKVSGFKMDTKYILLLYSPGEYNSCLSLPRIRRAVCAQCTISVVRGRGRSVSTTQSVPCQEVGSVIDVREDGADSSDESSEGLSD
jgi:hypothetical protein